MIHLFDRDFRDLNGITNARDTYIQLTLSAVLGLVGFFSFCILRPRWTGLYAARKKQNDEATSLPELPNTLFGWIPTLWSITPEQVLASAGLDAYAFLAFFKMAIKFIVVTLFFSLIVIKPVHDQYPDDDKKIHKNETSDISLVYNKHPTTLEVSDRYKIARMYDADYLWMYLAFAYFFTGLAIYLMIVETTSLIKIRQEYLGSQTTVTDRTIRLSGIPPDLRSEDKIQKFIEDLDIGNVETVYLCCDWERLDIRMKERTHILRKVERAKVTHMRNKKRKGKYPDQATSSHPGISELEESPLIGNGQESIKDDSRPTKRLWYGRWWRSKKIDAIDYYEEKLRRLDEEIRSLRQMEFEPASIAFVTMDSVATCQMACQAVLDPSPMQLMANKSPSPNDVIWKNTYLPRSTRMFRAWSITFFMVFLTIFWSVVLVPIAGILDLATIHKIWPQLGDFLDNHKTARSIVQTQLPTLILSLLNVAVPYLYAWLSRRQGMTSQGDVELSVISKNFFFTFFNFFVIFTALGTASLSLDNIGNESLRETANKLALSIQDLRKFYVNYVILQGVGLYPLRLLEFGSVALYPVWMLMAKTPRERAQLIQPPVFSYGFYLPQTILIFMICIVYSCLRASWEVLFAGLAYFLMGYFCYKYQLLYAMDHRQASTGKSWMMVCNRIAVGLVVMQITIAGQLALRGAVRRSVGMLPLMLATIWFSHVFRKNYTPLMTFIALKCIRKAEQIGTVEERDHDSYDAAARRYESATSERSSLEGRSNVSKRFVNPNLVLPYVLPYNLIRRFLNDIGSNHPG
ncbi:DUF221-domain-containing protein [Eremomyces bilateralis CBS 781.70]|uniref:DUF221-domain-containing protein n=1 Tax=Eremomyces bilateralis CBS 781.70 TaxID=1392243 RepID=A0A6G1GA21_9PEZI|nr:DUF221-domain-containing protein [Eremomyces bilateralis CBS 781.70]KAF1814874.1 DUF221-domain-containing protein [Eremomyces bilateralis CBS 781.70]